MRSGQAVCPVGNACMGGVATPCTLGSTFQSSTGQTLCAACMVCAPGLNATTACTVSANTVCSDVTKPVITLLGASPVILEAKRDTYVEAGYAAVDSYDGNITSKVVITTNINTNAVSGGNVTYTISDAAHNTAVSLRGVSVVDTTPPTITLNGDISVYVLSNATFVDPKATSIDLVDGNLTSTIKVTNSSVNLPSYFILMYTSTDKSNNTAYAYRRINIVLINTAPNISLVGPASITLAATRSATTYTDPGAVAYAWNGVSLASKITVVWLPSPVNYSQPGLYNGNYSVPDSNYTSSVIRQVQVSDLVPPILTLSGSATVLVQGGTNFTDPGVTYSDNLDTNATLTTLLSITGATINVYSPDGTASSIMYSLHDTSGNYAPSVTRTVTIIDTIPPVITVLGNATVTVEAATSYTDAGAKAADLHDITDPVVTTGAVNLKPASTPAVFSLVYSSQDAAGNVAIPQTRTVTVVDTTPPIMTLYSASDVTIEVFSSFTANITSVDMLDGELTPNMTTLLTVNNCSSLGVYTVTYTSQDKAGNAAPAIVVTVRVVDTTPPVISPVSGSFLALQGGTYFVYYGASAIDSYDGNVTSKVVQVGLYQFSPETVAALFNVAPPLLSSPDWSSYPLSFFSSYNASQVLTFTNIGTLYVFVFMCTDTSNNTGYGYRTVSLIDTWAPIIYLLTPNVDTLEGQKYPRPVTSSAVGAIAQDIHDGVIVNVGSVASSSLGGVGSVSMISSDAPIGTVYTVTYYVSDQAGNKAANVTQTITVVDTTPPVLTMQGPLNDTVGAGVVLPGDVFTATSFDAYDGNLTSSIVINFDGPGAVHGNATFGYVFNISGVYEMHFTSTDLAGNTWIENRTIEVLPAPGHSADNAGSIAIIGAVLGAVFGIILIAVAFLVYGAAERSRKRRRLEQARSSAVTPERRPSVLSGPMDIYGLSVLASSAPHQSKSWFHGLIPREVSEKRLQDAGFQDGMFLIRSKDATETTFTLSLVHKQRPFHFLIVRQGDKMLFQGQDVTESWGSSLIPIIEHLQVQKEKGVPTLLLTPVSRPELQSDDRACLNTTYESTVLESNVDSALPKIIPMADSSGYGYSSVAAESDSDGANLCYARFKSAPQGTLDENGYSYSELSPNSAHYAEPDIMEGSDNAKSNQVYYSQAHEYSEPSDVQFSGYSQPNNGAPGYSEPNSTDAGYSQPNVGFPKYSKPNKGARYEVPVSTMDSRAPLVPSRSIPQSAEYDIASSVSYPNYAELSSNSTGVYYSQAAPSSTSEVYYSQTSQSDQKLEYVPRSEQSSVSQLYQKHYATAGLAFPVYEQASNYEDGSHGSAQSAHDQTYAMADSTTFEC